MTLDKGTRVGFEPKQDHRGLRAKNVKALPVKEPDPAA